MLRTMIVFARKDDLTRAAALVDRAETLYPRTSELAEVKTMLERLYSKHNVRGRVQLVERLLSNGSVRARADD